MDLIKEVQAKFESLEKQRQTLLQQVQAIYEEQLRLQGEYRILMKQKEQDEGNNNSGG